MPRYVVTVKAGVNGAAVNVRDVETGLVIAFNLFGPRELVEGLLRAMLRPPEFEVKWE